MASLVSKTLIESFIPPTLSNQPDQCGFTNGQKNMFLSRCTNPERWKNDVFFVRNGEFRHIRFLRKSKGEIAFTLIIMSFKIIIKKLVISGVLDWSLWMLNSFNKEKTKYKNLIVIHLISFNKASLPYIIESKCNCQKRAWLSRF